MKVLRLQPLGRERSRPVGLTLLCGLAALLGLYVASSSAAKPGALPRQTSALVNGSSSLTLADPPGATSGDVLLAAIDADVPSVTSISAPPGWTLVRSDFTQSPTGRLTQAIYVKLAGSSEPSTWSWTFGSSANAAGGISAYSGIDPTSPVDVTSGAVVTAKTKTLTAPSLTTTQGGETLVAAYGASGRSPAGPDGMLLRWRIATTGASSTLSDSVLSSAGATGDRASPLVSSGTRTGIAQLVSLRPTSTPAGTQSPGPTQSSGPTQLPPTKAPAPAPVTAPTNTSAPSVSGATTQGQTLTASTGMWLGSPTSYAYRWQGCDASGLACADIAAATAASHTLTSGDVGRTLRVVVTATNAGGSAAASSAATVAVTAPVPTPAAAPANVTLPAISGTAVQGQTLTTSTGTWSGSPTAYAYRWVSCDASGAACAGIAGATGASLTLSSNEVGKAIQVVVSASNASGSAAATSNRTPKVAALPATAPTQPGCTLYVAPNGNSGNSGTSPTSPLTITGAASKVAPGSVVCLEAGTYTLTSPLYLSRAGSPSAYIVYRNYSGNAVLTSNFAAPDEIIQVQSTAAYLEFDGLSFDGRGTNANQAIHIKDHAHHIRVINNVITNMGSAGIATSNADYVTFVGNTIRRFGDGVGWSSGISFNSNAGAWWYDNAPGFHNIIADNIISGGVDNSSNHTDGNGVILDLGGTISPTLITNNVIYMNGGNGIQTNRVSGAVYVVNNTLYDNGLDVRVAGTAELFANRSTNQVWANNIAYAWSNRNTYKVFNGAATLNSDAQYGGLGVSGVVNTAAGTAHTLLANPGFVRPPFVDPTADGQWRNAPTASALGDGLALQPTSPFVGSGVDPRTLPGLTPALLDGINQYTMTGINGLQRPGATGYDYGAYQR